MCTVLSSDPPWLTLSRQPIFHIARCCVGMLHYIPFLAAVAELQEDTIVCHGIHSPAETQVPLKQSEK